MRNTHIGSTFESFLEEQGFREQVDLLAQKRAIAWQIEQVMAEETSRRVEVPRTSRPVEFETSVAMGSSGGTGDGARSGRIATDSDQTARG